MMKNLFCIPMLAVSLLVLPSIAQADNKCLDKVANADQARQNSISRTCLELEDRGYQIKHIKVNDNLGMKTVDIEAIKHGVKYNIQLDYSSLRVISEKRGN